MSKSKKVKNLEKSVTNYHYSKLSEVNTKDKQFEKTYFYAFVVDACAPYKPEKFKKFMCNLKIVDESIASKVPMNCYFFAD